MIIIYKQKWKKKNVWEIYESSWHLPFKAAIIWNIPFGFIYYTCIYLRNFDHWVHIGGPLEMLLKIQALQPDEILAFIWDLRPICYFHPNSYYFVNNTDATSFLSPLACIYFSNHTYANFFETFVHLTRLWEMSQYTFFQENVASACLKEKYSWCNHFFPVLIRSPVPVRNT